MTEITFRVLYYLLTLPAVLFALTFHELSHGFIADKLGDHTAKNMGRLTLNPLKHLDLFGFICMLLFHFGWAKPVPINARNFKNPKAGMAITALAGPVSNLILGFLNMLLFYILFSLFPAEPGLYAGAGALEVLYYFLILATRLNITFAVFNLIPIPPLDGSRVVLSFLPQKQYFFVMRYEQKIMLGFFIFILFDSYVLERLLGFSILSYALSFCTGHIMNGMASLIGIFF